MANMDSVINFFTSKTGIIAAIAVIVSLIGGVLKIVLPLLKQHKDRQASIADLNLSNVKIEDPPPWSEAAKASFELMNPQGGKAVMSDLLLMVTDNGKSETPKMVEAAAPVPQFNFKVTLEPGVNTYDVRKKEFGTPAPHSYEKGEIEAFSIELRSTEPQWYEFYFLVRWYDVSEPTSIRELKTPRLKVEFKPGVEDLIQ